MYENDAVFEALDEMVDDGRIAAYGVSVETSAQALAAIARPHVATVQIILNCFRLKPLEEVLPGGARGGGGIIARVPLASGLLSGRYDENTTFAASDHRNFNRAGEAFDVGRDVRRRALRGRRPGGAASSRRSSTMTRASPSSPCAGSSTSRA